MLGTSHPCRHNCDWQLNGTAPGSLPQNTDGTVDLLHGSDNYVGTHCFDLEQRVMEFTGDVWILRLKRHLRQGNEAALCTFLHTHATARSGWTFAGAYRAGMDYLKNPALHAARRGLDAGSASPGVSDEEGQSDVEHPRMFCSKFVAHALKEVMVHHDVIRCGNRASGTIAMFVIVV